MVVGEVPYCSGAFQRDGEKHLTWLARDQLDILKVSRGSARSSVSPSLVVFRQI